MSEVTGTLESTAEPEVTSEELRWRMEKVIQYAAETGELIDEASRQFNRALQILRSEEKQDLDDHSSSASVRA